MRDFRLYVILDEEICRSCGDIAETAHKVILGRADILQLRAKSLPNEKISKIAREIKDLAQETKTAFVLNDLVELAKNLDVDGVHLGQEDLSIKDARKILGENKIIGLSTHSVEQAVEAEKQGANYISIGPMYTTTLKPQANPLALEIITKVKQEIMIPFVAVGGINLESLDIVLAAGAQRVAVCRAIIAAKDVTAATKEFRQRLYQ